MATFAQWLDQDVQVHRKDDVGACARAWFAARSEYEGGDGRRPTISALKSITRWLMEQSGVELPPERIADAMATAGNLYRKAEARLVAGDQPPPVPIVIQPAEPPAPPVQPAQPPQLSPAPQQFGPSSDELRREWLEAAGVIGDHLGRIETKLDTLTHLVNGLTAQPAHEQLVMVDDAGELRDNDGRLESELPEAVLSWQDGLHMIHCRDDRCMGGKMCDCPCHELLPVRYESENTVEPAGDRTLTESGIDEAVEIGRAFGLDPQMLADAAAAARQRLDQDEARQRSLRRQDELSRPAHPDQQARTYRSLYRSQRDDQDSK